MPATPPWDLAAVPPGYSPVIAGCTLDAPDQARLVVCSDEHSDLWDLHPHNGDT